MTVGPDPILINAAVYLGSAVAAVAIFKRLGLGSILGFLAAGAVIGPAGLGLIPGDEDILHIAEFGVVLLLFVIGLELQPTRLWRMRGEILGLGAMQVGITGGALFVALWLMGLNFGAALVAGLGLALSSTAFGAQILRERGEFGVPYGRRAFSILLFQDMAVVPLLALAALLAPAGEAGGGVGQAIVGVAAIGALLVIGKFGLPVLFRLLAVARADEAFAGAALLVVVLAALTMQSVGLSMALGAFLAGVMLAETEFRHQIETDIEPFRSLFLGLFFIAVGMAVDWDLAILHIWTVMGGAVGLFGLKAGMLYVLSRRQGSSRADSLRIAALLGQSGEFAFVLLSIAASSALLDPTDSALLTATVGVSMALTPGAVLMANRYLASREKSEAAKGLEGVDKAEQGAVIVAGFGRTGQVVARMMNMRGYALTLIDNSPTRIRMAEKFGNKVFFGDGSRLDVLTMAGAGKARAIFLCINDRYGAQKAVARLRERFPDQLIMAMTYDRFSDIEMRAAGADVSIRETFESAIELARKGLEKMGDNRDIDDLVEEFRRRDQELIRLQIEFGAHEAVQKMREKYEIADR